MTRFKKDQRVQVNAIVPHAHMEAVSVEPVMGTVFRLLKRDDSAWIKLDTRVSDNLHPFPDDDERGRNVLAWPEDCEPELQHRTRALAEARGHQQYSEAMKEVKPVPTLLKAAENTL